MGVIIIMATDVWTRGTINGIKQYDIQTVEINPNDVILLHISSNLSLRDIQAIEKEVRSEFPENRVLVVNRQVLEGMTVLRKGTTEVSLIEDPVDVNKIFDEMAEFAKYLESCCEYMLAHGDPI